MHAPQHPHPPGTPRTHVLVLGYGSTLFGEDSLAQLIAQHVAEWARPGVLALARHELTPDLAADVTAADEVIFVDATLHTDGVVFVPVLPDSSPPAAALPTLTPSALLAVTQHTFGHAPKHAWQLLIPAEDFTLGGTLSVTTREGLARALAGIAHRA